MSKRTQHTAIVQHHADGSKTIRLGAPLQSSSSQGTLGPGATCSRNSQCANNACAIPYLTAPDEKVCCPYPGSQSYPFGNTTFCTQLPVGYSCGTNAVCASGICNVGQCANARSQPSGAVCMQNSVCQSGTCSPGPGGSTGRCTL